MFSNKGSISIYLLSLIPLIMAAMYVLHVLFGFSESNFEVTQKCIKEQIKMQEQIKKSLRSLFKLNPKAEGLRAKYLKARKELALAMASMNAGAISAARAKVSLIWSKRVLLDLEQKSIIRSINLYLHASQNSLKSELLSVARGNQKQFQLLADYDISDLKLRDVKLSVVADSAAPAPVYSFSKNFPEEQALEMTWVLKLETRGPAAQFLPVSSRFKQTCSTTINHKEEEWPTVMRKVNLSLKRSS